MTFHTAFMLEYENALLAVVPGLTGLPYWNMHEEFKGGSAKFLLYDHH